MIHVDAASVKDAYRDWAREGSTSGITIRTMFQNLFLTGNARLTLPDPASAWIESIEVTALGDTTRTFLASRMSDEDL